MEYVDLVGPPAGTSRLVGGNAQRLLRAAEELLCDQSAYQAMARAHNPYGDGPAPVRMVDVVRHHLGLGGAAAGAVASRVAGRSWRT